MNQDKKTKYAKEIELAKKVIAESEKPCKVFYVDFKAKKLVRVEGGGK